MEAEKLSDKLKSMTRWGTVAASVVPLIGQAVTGQVGWLEAIIASVSALVVGLGLIAKKDWERYRAAAQIEKAKAISKLPPLSPKS